MDERFSRKEFIVAFSLDFYPWRVAWSVAWKLVLLGILLWIGAVARWDGKWFVFCFVTIAFFIAWGLLKKRTAIRFDLCPNCGKKIFIRFDAVNTDPPGKGLLHFSLLPQGIVVYREGVCPHCLECVWRDEPASYISPLLPVEALELIRLRDIGVVILLLLVFAAALLFLLMGSLRCFTYLNIPDVPAIVFSVALVPLVLRGFFGIIVHCIHLPQCPACRRKFFETEIETKTGRCHFCGERIVNVEDEW